MRLFLDSSVLLAACGSTKGASRLVINRAATSGWSLLASPYVADEVLDNLAGLSTGAGEAWDLLRDQLTTVPDVVTADRPVVFSASKDRPILLSALAWADVLLTLDRADFGEAIGRRFYELDVLTPGDFLGRERAAGRVAF